MSTGEDVIALRRERILKRQEEEAQENAERGLFAASEVIASTLTENPPPREWVWRDWIPVGVVTGLAGPPGISKSTFGLQACAHKALGRALLGESTGLPGVCLFASVEDDMLEMNRRLVAIARGMGVSLSAFGDNLRLHDLTEAAPCLVQVDRDGVMAPTPEMELLREHLDDVRPAMLVLDLANDFWSGEDTRRREVTVWIRGYLGRLASQYRMAVLALSHPSVSGQREGRAFAGSTAVLGSYRSGISMTPADPADPDGPRLLERVKRNYAPYAKALVRYVDGYLEHQSDDEARADRELLERELEAELREVVASKCRPDGWITGREAWQALGGPVKADDPRRYETATKHRLKRMAQNGALKAGQEKTSNRSGTRFIYREKGR